MKIRVLVVDDSPLIRAVLRETFERTSDIEVVAEAADGRQAIDEVLEMNGQDVTIELLQAFHRIQAGTDPMADIGAGSQQRPATLDRGQDDGRIPVVVGFLMFVDGHFDVVFLAQLFHRVERDVLPINRKEKPHFPAIAAISSMPSAFACAANSSGCEPPRRKEKLLVAASSQ